MNGVFYICELSDIKLRYIRAGDKGKYILLRIIQVLFTRSIIFSHFQVIKHNT